MRDIEHPTDHPFDTHPEGSMRNAPELMDLADPFIPGIVSLALFTETLLSSVYIVGGAAAAYRRSIIAQLGGFDEK